ncbi:Cof-type HAD-IIB family hydrolase [Longibaculum muris]|uniref:Cof subfamily protein (Haloacid dehalogenase superfamily)/HAD superfamily hydrolase (TIGR01484 family) n=1 Tax=Longibaculum muris TaxID=1796628 RepID=A0A4R3YM17_9FIRM|nr:Cof-type HAD-IIB family hydrolase [Longibaculum muris]MBS5371563.1 Cof-type HAD-IIB family hydrolase [Coprobacillus cateniformis]MCR1889154.1 Cof-type HAD-IIB family hydrolase [Longibaculum muris]TCV92518.1 hypothetical protein EDD60_1261 [Longibaculum muris]
MSRKVLFFDIDGTLVESRLGIVDIPQTVKDEMKRLQGLGHKLFISSGRPRAMLNQEILEAGFDGYILANGAYVEIDGQSIYEDRMDATLAVKTMEMLEKLDCSYMIETAKHVYIDNQNNDLYDFFDKVGFASQFKTEFDKYDVIQRTLKIEANVTDENREKVIDYIKNDFGYVVNYDEHGSENAFELYSPTISKAVGIQKVLEYYNLTKDDTYAFGDGINDLEMIQYCHVGVAMGNAVKELKDVADLICRRIDEDGLARILKILF